MELIKHGQELYDVFRNMKGDKKLLSKGVYISSAIRREVLTSERQGRITINGTPTKIIFENNFGGVYRASVNIP